MMRTSLLTLVLVLVAAAASGQVRVPPSGCITCPPLDSWECVMWPDVCQVCWDNCDPERLPFRRVFNTDYRLPRAVGAASADYEHIWTTPELFDELELSFVRTATIWMQGDPMGGPWCWSPEWWDGEEPFACSDGDPLMDLAWTHPGIDVIVIRATSPLWAGTEYGSDLSGDSHNVTFAGEPTYDLATALYDRYGDQNKVIIFSEWEQDWAIRGQGGYGTYSWGTFAGLHRYPWLDAPAWYGHPYVDYPHPYTVEGDGCIDQCIMETGQVFEDCYHECGDMIVANRADYVMRVIEGRQLAIEQARKENRGARLRIFHSVAVNKYPTNSSNDRCQIFVTDLVALMENKPDLIGVSFWSLDLPITDMLDWIEERTGYPRGRIWIEELGSSRDDEQYERIYNETRRAWCWGARLVELWLWKQTWCADRFPNGDPKNNFGLWRQEQPCEGDPVFTEPRPGYFALRDLLRRRFSYGQCDDILALPPTR